MTGAHETSTVARLVPVWNQFKRRGVQISGLGRVHGLGELISIDLDTSISHFAGQIR
ncbi:MAG: hypothetical protein AAF670_19295 [Planctomycetota bacterium]